MVALFLVSAYVMAVETMFTRLFAVINWSEYGHWVISIVMLGFAASGILLALFPRFFEERRRVFLGWLPVLLIPATIYSYWGICATPFNPYELQNEILWPGQMLGIARYYLSLSPLFFLAGLYVGLSYLELRGRIALAYGCDLLGAALGAIAILIAMRFIHPFSLAAAALPLVLAAALLNAGTIIERSRRSLFRAGLVAACALAVVFIGRSGLASFPFYKPVYAALNITGNRLVHEEFSPRGYYQVLENVSEYNNIDLSNNYDTLGFNGPPRASGLYRDGRRITSLKKDDYRDYSYLRGALGCFPYLARRAPRVLLIGTNGGFRVGEAMALGAASVLALEPEPVVHRLVTVDRAEVNRSFLSHPRVQVHNQSPFSLRSAAGQSFDLVEISADLLGSAENGEYLVTADAIGFYFDLLARDGLIAVPVSISQFTVYALKMLENARTALVRAGVGDPARHIMIYRSSWTAVILIGRRPVGAADISALREFCSERSFDVSFHPGIDPARAEIWNDLPAVSFADATYEPSERAQDALMAEATALLGDHGRDYLAHHFFNLRASTADRPGFFTLLRLNRLGLILPQISLVPQEEVGTLVSLAVLIQAFLFAILTMLLPLARLRRGNAARGELLRTIVYFAGLGLAFLFVEIALIERFTLFLGDGTTAFALVLAGMLAFSGLGSVLAQRFHPRRGVVLAVAIIAAALIFYALFLFDLMRQGMNVPFTLKILFVLAAIAPAALAMGMPFPLGLASLRKEANDSLLPWAWAINGAFSVIATPLASLIATNTGYTAILAAAAALYALALAAFPGARNSAAGA